jgi:hypothetical protein
MLEVKHVAIFCSAGNTVFAKNITNIYATPHKDAYIPILN